MAKFDFQYVEMPGQIVLRAEADPAHFGGGRNAFGPFLRFRLYWPYDANLPKHRALSVQGALTWGSDQDGLSIPHQVVTPNGPITIPISDDQLVRLEERRAGGEPEFSIRLEGLAQSEENLAVRAVGHGYQTNRIAVSRDAWKTILAQCGFGLRRIIELPPPPTGLGGKWDEASQSLALASQRLAQGHDEEAIAAVRKVVERIVEAVGDAVGKPREKSGAFQPYVDQVANHVRDLPAERAQNPFPLASELLKAAFRWTSGYVHKEAATSQRDEAVFAIGLAVALYGLTARGTLTAARAHQDTTK